MEEEESKTRFSIDNNLFSSGTIILATLVLGIFFKLDLIRESLYLKITIISIASLLILSLILNLHSQLNSIKVFKQRNIEKQKPTIDQLNEYKEANKITDKLNSYYEYSFTAGLVGLMLLILILINEC